MIGRNEDCRDARVLRSLEYNGELILASEDEESMCAWEDTGGDEGQSSILTWPKVSIGEEKVG